jgi:hypothetical protein
MGTGPTHQPFPLLRSPPQLPRGEVSRLNQPWELTEQLPQEEKW